MALEAILYSQLDPTDLERYLCLLLQRDVVAIEEVTGEGLSLGTSGDQLYLIVVKVRGDMYPVRLILKAASAEHGTEAQFYRTLADRVPVDTPRLVASGFHEARDWVLMEEIQGRDGLTWSEADYHAVVEDLALLHASFWGRTKSLHQSWLQQPTPEALEETASQLQALLAQAADSWMVQGVPEMFGPGRLDLMERVVEDYARLAGILLSAGETLVHGDLWFHNVLITHDGRRVMLDWQGCRVWSGFWEFAYFLNLLRAVGPGIYRDMPIPENRLTSWYRSALEQHGILFTDGDFTHMLTVARVLQPLLHWLPQVAPSATQHAWVDGPAVQANRAFLNDTFTVWEVDARRILASSESEDDDQRST